MLEKALIEEIKKNLSAEKGRLIDGGIKAFSGCNSDNESPSDFCDRSSVDAEKDLSFRIKERERNFINKINEALDKIENGTFGECEECSSEIGIKRIQARPTVSLCIQCKEKQERREKLEE